MLVSRWGILKKALLSRYTILKVKELVRCLCSLHNFLIGSTNEPRHIPVANANDSLNMHMQGSILVDESTIQELDNEKNGLVNDLVHGGEHLDDQNILREPNNDNYLPREILKSIITEGDHRRPVPSIK